MKIFFGLASLLLLFCACKSHVSHHPLFQLVDSSGINFNNNVVDGQLENSFYFRNYYNGGGVAIGDLNNDGLPDVMMTSNMGQNKLYLNKGNFSFTDVSASAGLKQDGMWSTGVVFVDINNDGWLDIYECNSGHMKNGNRRNKLYINNHVKADSGGQTVSFTESASQYHLDIKAYTTQVSFFDYDLDGDLDCFMINNSPVPINTIGDANRRSLPEAEWPIADFLKGGGDHLFRNDGGIFKEVTIAAGIHGSLMSFGLGVSVGDINNDGYPDVYVANDSYERDYLYINQKNGTFRDDIETWTGHNSFSSMGADISDINNDGYNDIFTTDMLPGDDYRLKTLGAFDNIDLYRTRVNAGFYHQFMQNCVFVNNQDGGFIEAANYGNVAASDWSWGGLFFDADNDGYNDVFVCNGINHDVTNLDFMDFFANEVVQQMVISGKKQNVDSVLKHIPVYPIPNKMFRNNGDLRFTDVSESWGLAQPSASNGSAYGDLDNDGDLDLVVNNENGPAFVYRNGSREQNGNNYIGISLKGRGANSYAVGSKMRVYAGSQVFYRELYPSRGFQSSVDYKQVIGLGKLVRVDSVIVIWPDRSYSRYEGPAVNKVHEWQQPEAGKAALYDYAENKVQPVLEQVAVSMDGHREDDYIDFYSERNLPELLSREGPRIGRADVNGDGLQDLYICGASGQAGQLYIQTAAGGFMKKEQEEFTRYAAFEEVAVLFFDADNDGDEDLFIGSGGNHSAPGSRELQHRLYINDGKGNFRLDARSFSTNSMNCSVAVANDFDGDGDQDLFVGSRSVPYNYGLTPESYLYVNDGTGHFTDKAAAMNPGISQAGLVTGAVWADVSGDGRKELIITGEWMATRIFSYNGHSFDEQKNTGLSGLYGWWQTIAAADVNGDGKQDLVVGNIGENFYLRPDKDHPAKLWISDFDQNGSLEQFLTRSIGGRDMPVFLKREITDQFPALKKQNLKHSDYATKSIGELFGREVMEKTAVKQFNYCPSIVAINDGKGGFRVTPLPVMVQLSSVNAIYCGDLNGDGSADLVLGGNKFGLPPQFGRLDGSYGHLLYNDGHGSFRWLGPKESGISLRGEIRDIREVEVKDRRCLLVVQNNERPVMYQLKKL